MVLPAFVCVHSVGASLCLSFRLGVGAQKKPPVKGGTEKVPL